MWPKMEAIDRYFFWHPSEGHLAWTKSIRELVIRLSFGFWIPAVRAMPGLFAAELQWLGPLLSWRSGIHFGKAS